MRNAQVELILRLTNEEAAALAAFLRRAGYSEFRECAKDNCEAYRMLHAASQLRDSLWRAGYG
jgi:hypothetical protein